MKVGNSCEHQHFTCEAACAGGADWLPPAPPPPPLEDQVCCARAGVWRGPLQESRGLIWMRVGL